MEQIKNRIIASSLSERLINSPSDMDIVNQRRFHDIARSMTELFENHFPHVDVLPDEKIMKIYRYFMVKAAETCISDELYASNKERICSISYIWDDIDKVYHTINIPAHYIFELQDLAMHYLIPIKETIEYIRENGSFVDMFSAAIEYWQMVAYTNAYLRKSYKAHGRYENSTIKTLDEVMICALRGISQNLLSSGWSIKSMNYKITNPWNMIAQYGNDTFALLVRVNYGHSKASVTIDDVKELAEFAKEKDYPLGYILVDINSSDSNHKEDNVIIIGDSMNCQITKFNRFSKK